MSKYNYPYLGRTYIDGKQYVVFFTEEDYGVVVHDETENEKIKLGLNGSFAEEKFEPLPPDVQISIHN